MTEELLANFSGSFLGQMKGIDLNEYAQFYEEYKSLLYSSPFQLQAELLFVMRALGILSGITSGIAPAFSPMDKVVPFATRLMVEELQPSKEKVLQTVPRLLKLPARFEDVLLRAQRGQLSFQTELTAGSKKTIRQLQHSVNWLALVVAAAGLFVAGAVWHAGGLIAAVISQGANQRDAVGMILMALGGAAFILGMLTRRKG
jgi:predicted unusual protein kinase regulating ubiquinone biosynthesis (AarF/ABC1/UbiB family)